MNRKSGTATPITRYEFELSLQHPIVLGFSSHPENALYVQKFIHEPNTTNQAKLNQAFKAYLFAIRFTKYLSSLITNSRIDYLRKIKKEEERELLIFDKPGSDEDTVSLGEILSNVYNGDDIPQVTVDPDVFQSQLNNEWLYDGFSQLTPKQKYVITLAYSSSSRDSEIALLLHVTQQSVSKTRQRSLQKLKQCIPPAHFETAIEKEEM
ncbi:sigma-70 family RNA polymerase sigma factor [Paenibacillus sp. sgz5001063]|uniref:sigma-70 family RNA polymerase sigma factor n=1 Tax=Paenibacillus sp. sgz5001063 TaxID=3242474 RepID=UPI0036D29E92